jgi:hypothetical protein
MALNFNVSPYFDDFDPTKNFHRILFKPGVAVQARELTQSQTILQNQISNFASSVFSTNTPVSGGSVTTNLNCYYIRLNLQYNNVNITAANFLNKVIQDSTTGTILAKVIATTEATGTATNPGDPPTLIVTYLSGGLQFTDGETIIPTDGSSFAAQVTTSTASNPSTGLSSAASISSGVYYIVNGYSQSSTPNADGTYTTYSIGNFVQVNPQTVVLDKYDNTPNLRIGLLITETIVDYVDDSSLLDPAVGASNYQAPGADRYLVSLSLTTLPLSLGNDQNFIELVRMVNGQIVTQVDGTSYSTIDDYFAKRDYETNGDYIVNPFTFTTTPNAGGNSNKYDLNVSKGIAYVHGYRIENQSPLTLTSDRARNTQSVLVNDVYMDYGSYFYVDTVKGFFDVTTLPAVDIHCVPAVSINSTNVNTYLSTFIGTANVRNMVYVTDSGSSNTTSYVYRAYVSRLLANTLTGTAASATATTLTINDPTDRFSTVANAYYNMTLTITGGTDAGDIRTVASYNGATKSFTVSSPFTTTPDSTSTFLLSMPITTAQALVQKNSSYVLTANANINTAFGKQGSVSTGATVLENPAEPELIFPVGNQYVANIAGSSYTSTKDWRNVTFSSGSTPSLQLNMPSGSSLNFIGGVGTVADSVIKQNYTMVNASSGQLINITSAGGFTVVISSTKQTVTFTANTSAYANMTVDVSALINIINADASAGGILKVKNLINGNTSLVSTSGPSSGGALNGTTYVDLTNGQTYITNAGTGTGKLSLYVSDVKNIVKIIDTGSPSVTPTTAMLTGGQYDVTNNYILDNGQRDDHYGHASIQLAPGANAAAGNLLIIFNYYSHLPLTGDGYFSVMSYLGSSNGGISTSPEAYQNIPTYTAKDGVKYRLADCLDFRPTRTSATVPYSYEYYNAVANQGGTFIPLDMSQFQSQYSYYLGRKDLLVLSKDKSFQIIEGSPAVAPILPAAPNGSLVLANLSLDPYTAYVPGENPPGQVPNLSITTVPHNRWAKSDITDLQTRVNNLEYYTSLSLLETNAQSLQIPDTNGLNRFKNGILVDDFSSFATADTTNPDWLANVNIRKQQLGPAVVVDNFQLQNPYVLNSLGTVDQFNTFAVASLKGTNTNLYTLPYTTANIVTQPLATSDISVNPFSVVTYQGVAKLFPAMDNWVDTAQAPAILTTDPTIQVSQQLNGINYTNISDFASLPGTSASINSSTSSFSPSTTYTSLLASSATTTTSTTSSALTVSNGYLTNISVLPYIRPQQIGFNVQGLLANAPVSVFFDGVNVNQFITTPDTIELTSVSGTFNEGDIVGFIDSNSGNFSITARVEGTYVYPGTTNVRLYVSKVLGAPAYTNTTTVQNGQFNSSGVYTGSTASGTVNNAAISISASGNVTGVNGTFQIASAGMYRAYKVQNPNTWGSFMNQYGVWGDMNESTSYNASFSITFPTTQTYYFIYAADDTAQFTLDGSTIITMPYYSASSWSYSQNRGNYQSTTTYSQSVTAGTHTIAWSAKNASGTPGGVALVIQDASGNIVFASNNPPLTMPANVTALNMINGGQWFTGVTELQLDQTAANVANYYVGSQINVTSTYVYEYVVDTASFTPPTTSTAGGVSPVVPAKQSTGTTTSQPPGFTTYAATNSAPSGGAGGVSPVAALVTTVGSTFNREPGKLQQD